MKNSLYDAGFKAGNRFMFNEVVDMTLKCVMLSLWKNDFPPNDIKIMRDDITDAIFYYGKHIQEMDELIKEMEAELGFATNFHGRYDDKEVENAKKTEGRDD